MNINNLKTNVVVNIAFILLISMILIDIVSINISQKEYIRSEISKGHLFSSVIEQNIQCDSGGNTISINLDNRDKINEIFKKTGYLYLNFIDNNGQSIFLNGDKSGLNEEISDCMNETSITGKNKEKLFGSTWGVFWRQKRNLVLATPIHCDKKTIGTVCLVADLNDIYSSLRKSQKIILIYILINTFIFTTFGLYRIYNIAIRPINNLVKRTEEYTDEDGFNFIIEDGQNEFGQLSKSLNMMLNRISDDKNRLQSSLISLEKANNEIKKAQNDIIRGEKLATIGRLSAGIAHEIGNPIGIVLGYLELIKQKTISDDEKNDYINRSVYEINRINTIIKQLLDFSRSGAEILKNVSVHDIINDVVNILKVQPVMKNIKFESILLSETDIVKADQEQLKQVFINLVINAADAISLGENKLNGKIIIKSEAIHTLDIYNEKQSILRLKFSDNGHGINDSELKNIFDPFYTTKEPGKGTGLGLSVCFMIIDQAGGTIKADSADGKGTTIIVDLPMKIA
ncbi:MAG: hypothetical protein HOB70_02560 [Chloroflexi bacterium]|nr:hypothetical protein [Chloroflexota bacterium]